MVNIPGDKSISIRWILLASQALVHPEHIICWSQMMLKILLTLKKMKIKKRKFFEIEGVGLNGFYVKNKQKIYLVILERLGYSVD